MRKTATWTAIVSLGMLFAGGPSLAEETKDKAPDEKALVEAMIKAAAPGENHKKLETFVGSWDATVKMWMDPSKPATESKATAETKWIMGERYLEEKVTGEFGGLKFLGQGITGYDNLQKKYTSAWVDNMGTSISTSTGSYDADKKTFTYQGEEIDPLSGKKARSKLVIHVLDKDKFEEEMFKEMDGKDIKVMHIDYTRSKK